MADARFDAVPADRRETARAALASAFGAAPLGPLAPIAGGASALTYRVEAGGRPYALRLEQARLERRNPQHHTCLRLAAEAGIAPALRYADAEAGVMVSDFVPTVPLADYPGGPVALARAAGRLIGRLHDIADFPPLVDYPAFVELLLNNIIDARLFAPGLLEPHMAGLQRLRAAYPWDPSGLVASHNDPNPRNILYDGQRLWLIDWETAYRNDPLVDVAILTLELAATPDLEAAVVEASLGRAPDVTLRARLVVMRQIVRLYYAGLVLSAVAATTPGRNATDLSAPTPDELRAAVASGRLKMGSPEMAFAFGKLLLAGYLEGLDAPGLEDALMAARG